MEGDKFDEWNEDVHTLLNKCADITVGDDRRTHVHNLFDAVLNQMPEYNNRHLLIHSAEYHPEVDWRHYHTVEAEGREDYDHTLDAHLHRMLDVYINEQYARGPMGLGLLYAIIFHDIGKKWTAEWNEERGCHQFIKHETVGQDIINDAWNDLHVEDFLAMEYIARFHTDFWGLTNVQKMRNVARNPNFPLLANLCRIDKMMDGDMVRKQHGLWMKRCGEFKKAMQPTEKEQKDFIHSCFALMDMNGNYMTWEMTKDGPINTGHDIETLNQLLHRIMIAQSMQDTLTMMNGAGKQVSVGDDNVQIGSDDDNVVNTQVIKGDGNIQVGGDYIEGSD